MFKHIESINHQQQIIIIPENNNSCKYYYYYFLTHAQRILFSLSLSVETQKYNVGGNLFSFSLSLSLFTIKAQIEKQC